MAGRKTDKTDKTNVMRLLEQKKIPYQSHIYQAEDGDKGREELSQLSGEEIARILGEDPERVFKTLVTRAKSGEYYVFVIPVGRELDLKKAARAVGEKSIEMIRQKELLPLTGYVHGGCSPLGMKKQFPTVIQEGAQDYDTIYFSGGRIGCQVEVAPQELQKILRFQLRDVVS